jgi:anthranilate phosphoribosyltransferase
MSDEKAGRRAALDRALQALAAGDSLGEQQVGGAFDAIMRGEATPEEIGALLLGLRAQRDGETAAVVAGVARALRRAMVTVAADRPGELVDTCGTGGGSVTTFNISTVAAFVAAGSGVRIAKHGNRSYTSRSGSADVLDALGIPLELPVAALSAVLAETGMVFMFAPQLHPAMRHVAPVRRGLGVPTVMNLVGPLANPAGAGRQVIGVADPVRLSVVAGALAALGTIHALVVHGAPGLDEISPVGPTEVVEVRGGAERRWTIDPDRLGLGGGTLDELAGGDPADNAALARTILAGRGPRAARSAVILNAAGAIYVAGRTATYPAAVIAATESLDRGAGIGALERFRAAIARHRL